jgi:alkylated DNA repair dioxygenase AlkB
VVLHQRAGASDFHPSAALPLENGDVLVALGGPEELSWLIHASGG